MYIHIIDTVYMGWPSVTVRSVRMEASRLTIKPKMFNFKLCCTVVIK